MLEKEMEDLLADHPEEFFPRFVWKLKGRQQSFVGVGRFDLLFEDDRGNSILVELKAVPARYEDANQLARYKDALEQAGAKRVHMWLVAPRIARPVAEYLDEIGVEHEEIHEARFRQIASQHRYTFRSERDEKGVGPPGALPPGASGVSKQRGGVAAPGERTSRPAWLEGRQQEQGGAAEFLSRCDEPGRSFFEELFKWQRAAKEQAAITWKHVSGFSMQFNFGKRGYVPMIWGFPDRNRDGAAGEALVRLPLDHAARNGAPDAFIEQFVMAVSAVAPLPRGTRPTVQLARLSPAERVRLLDTIKSFAMRAKSA